LCCIERGEHAFGKIAFRVLKGARHRGPDFVVEHQVRLNGKIRADDVTRGLNIVLSGPRLDTSLRIDHRHLSDFASVVFPEQLLQRVGRALACAHHVESVLAVTRIDERLRRNSADTRFSPRDD